MTLKGYEISWQRNLLARQALAAGADYIWMLDDDQIFSNMDVFSALKMLMAANVPIISGVTRLKRDGIPYSAYVLDPEGKESMSEDGPRLSPIEKLDGSVIDVHYTGGFCMLIKREVFDKMARPHYQIQDADIFYPEDFQFCDKARALGYSIKVHTGVKMDHILHTRDFEINCDLGFARLIT